MSFFDTIKETDLDASDEILLFPKDEVVEFTCIDFKEKADKNMLVVNCRVDSGEYKGKRYAHFIRQSDNPAARKIFASFMLAFWTKEEILGKQVKPARLMNRRFTGVASAIRDHQGKQYQQFGSFKDLGEGEASVADDIIEQPW